MWFSRNRKEAKREVQELQAFRAVGEAFQYLGRTCIVTGYWDILPGAYFPCLCVEYADGHGVIRHHKIYPYMLPSVIAQQPK